MYCLPTAMLTLVAISVTAPVLAESDIEADEPIVDFGTHKYSANGHVIYTLQIFNRGSTNLHIGELGGTNPLAPPFELGDGCAHQTLRPSEHCDLDVIEELAVSGTHETTSTLHRRIRTSLH